MVLVPGALAWPGFKHFGGALETGREIIMTLPPLATVQTTDWTTRVHRCVHHHSACLLLHIDIDVVSQCRCVGVVAWTARAAAGIFGSHYAPPVCNTTLAETEANILAKLDAYWEWIQNDTRMVGLNPYHWTDTNACLLKNTSACTHMCYDGVCGTLQAGILELLTRIAHYSPARAPSHSLWTFAIKDSVKNVK